MRRFEIEEEDEEYLCCERLSLDVSGSVTAKLLH